MLRVHTDRECAFLSRAFQSFCRKFGLYLANHDGRKMPGPSNGRIESEVHQVKRILRLLIKGERIGGEMVARSCSLCW